MFALFNQNKKFIGYSPDLPNVENLPILRKKIPEEFSDLTIWQWEGDYEDGKMVSNRKTIQLNVEQKILKKIIEKYPLGIQMINIIKQLHILSKNQNVFDSDFREMSEYVMEILSNPSN